jgi:hypothetical protein
MTRREFTALGWSVASDDDPKSYSHNNSRSPLVGAALRAHLISRGLIKPLGTYAIPPFHWDVPTLRMLGNEDTRPQPMVRDYMMRQRPDYT